MKRKTVILIGALALTLSDCSGEGAVDSTAETSEIIESTEQVSENGYQWVVSYQGITFYFQSEVLGEKEGTPIPVTILFDEKPELFTEKCKDVPRAYAMDMDSKCQYLIDTDGDGDCEKISTLYNVSGYEEIIDAELMIDDRKTVGMAGSDLNH